MELNNIILHIVNSGSEGQKSSSSSHADYRSKTKAVLLVDMGHTLRGECKHDE
jgi:hypothetical protein